MDSKPRTINVEPLMFLFSAGNQLYGTIYQAVFQYKLCLTRRPGELEFCRTLGTNMDDLSDSEVIDTRSLLNDVQATTAQYLIYNQIASTLPSIIIGLLAGAWCDSYGRKPPLIVACAGTALAIALALLAVTVEKMPFWTLIIAAFIKGSTGQIVVIHLASFAMLSDVVAISAKSHAAAFTIRVGISSGLSTLGSFAGSLLSGLILDYFKSYAYVYSIACAFATLATVYAVFLLRETLHWPKFHAAKLLGRGPSLDSAKDGLDEEFMKSVDETMKNNEKPTKIEEMPAVQIEIKKNIFIILYERLRQPLMVLAKPRPGRDRLYLIVTYCLFLTLVSAEPSGIFNLYAKRPPLSLTDSEFSYLTSISMVSMVFGKMVVSVGLKKLFKLSDMSLVIFGLIIACGQKIFVAFSTAAWMIVICNIIGGIAVINVIGFRSFFGSIVDTSERARIYAAVFIVDELGPLISSLIMNNLYAATLSIFPGTVFLVASAITAIIVMVLCWIKIDSCLKSKEIFTDVEKIEKGVTELKSDHNEKTPLLSNISSTKKVTFM